MNVRWQCRQRVGQREERIEAQVARELEPDVVANLKVKARRQPSRLEGLNQPPYPVALAAIRFAEAEFVAIDVPDDTRCRNL